MLALPARRGFEAHAEPGEIVEHRRLVSRLASRPVQVFNAQQQAPVRLGGKALVAERGIGMAEVQRPVGRGRESQDGRGCEGVGAHGLEADA